MPPRTYPPLNKIRQLTVCQNTITTLLLNDSRNLPRFSSSRPLSSGGAGLYPPYELPANDDLRKVVGVRPTGELSAVDEENDVDAGEGADGAGEASGRVNRSPARISFGGCGGMLRGRDDERGHGSVRETSCSARGGS